MKQCPPCIGLCELGDYCEHMTKAKTILDNAKEGRYNRWEDVEWALQITGDLPWPKDVEKEMNKGRCIKINDDSKSS